MQPIEQPLQEAQGVPFFRNMLVRIITITAARIAMNRRGYLADKNLHIFRNAHVHDPAADSALSVELHHDGGFPYFGIF